MIDLTLYNGEADLLALRVATLAGRVALHGVVEGLETFSGQAKAPGLLREPRLADVRPRLAYHVAPPLATPNPWEREAHQRGALAVFLADAPDETLVLVGDVDEIPDPADLPGGPGDLPDTEWGPAGVFAMSHRAYDARNVRTTPWRGTICTTAATARRLGCEGVRRLRLALPVIGGGWHFTHMGSLETLRHKVAAFSHQEYHTPQVLADLARRRAHGLDPFGRADEIYAVDSAASLPAPLAAGPALYPSLWRDAA